MKYNTEIINSFGRLESVLDEYSKEFSALYKEKLEKEGLKATGNLINSIVTNVKRGSDYYSITFNAKGYWKWVEEGRKAGKFPPLNAILNWIRVKKIIPVGRDGKLPTEKQLAFLISRSIAEKGTIKRFNHKGSKIVFKTVEELNRHYLPLMEKALQEDFEHVVTQTFDNAFGSLKVW